MAMSPAFQEQVPTPPIPPTPPGPPTVITGPNGDVQVVFQDAPLTARDVQALRQRGSELSRQLNSANGRRDELSRQLEDAEGVNKAGIEQRIAQLDQRIMGIEADIAANGRRLASAPARALPVSSESSVPAPFGLSSDQITGISIVGTLFVLFPLSVAWRATSGGGARVTPLPCNRPSRHSAWSDSSRRSTPSRSRSNACPKGSAS